MDPGSPLLNHARAVEHKTLPLTALASCLKNSCDSVSLSIPG